MGFATSPSTSKAVRSTSASGYEEGILAGFLARPDYASSVVLSPSDFSTEASAAVFEIIRRTTKPTPVVITEELARAGKPMDAALLHKLFAVKPEHVTKDEIDEYARQIRRDAVGRRMYRKVMQSSDLLRDGQIEDSIEHLSQTLFRANEELLTGEDPDVLAIVNRMRNQKPQVFFKSGLDVIDAATMGMRHGHVWVVSAPFKRRKTTVALHIAKSVLDQGKSVAYIALEDDDATFAQSLMANVGDFGLRYFDQDPKIIPQAIKAKMDFAEKWIQDKKFRVYDAKYGVHNFANVPAIIRNDKLKFDTDLVIIDYVQAWAEEYEKITPIVQTLLKTAAETEVCLLELSQMSGDVIRNGSPKGVFSTKGTTTFGQACHVGIELRYDKDRAPRKASIVRFPHDLGSAAEIGIHLKIARRAANQWTFLVINPESGKVYEQNTMPLYPSKPGEID